MLSQADFTAAEVDALNKLDGTPDGSQNAATRGLMGGGPPTHFTAAIDLSALRSDLIDLYDSEGIYNSSVARMTYL